MSRCRETYSLAAWDKPAAVARVVRCQRRRSHTEHRWHGGPAHLMPGFYLDRTELTWRDGYASLGSWDYTIVRPPVQLPG